MRGRFTGSAAGFLLARRIFDNPMQALGVAAVIASMPELMLTADHDGNEPFAIALGTAIAWTLCSIPRNRRDKSDWRGALLIGCLLGCGLLTKAHFLTMIPAIAGIYAVVVWRAPSAHCGPSGGYIRRRWRDRGVVVRSGVLGNG